MENKTSDGVGRTSVFTVSDLSSLGSNVTFFVRAIQTTLLKIETCDTHSHSGPIHSQAVSLWSTLSPSNRVYRLHVFYCSLLFICPPTLEYELMGRDFGPFCSVIYPTCLKQTVTDNMNIHH